ncbi:hypothetical protein [Virgisporangium aurantiacum]|uniref:Uncharacterized protein n=1 Tax=Virgisporangium aurantiacum TaxID=175570 RepID=A0A8J3Z5T3_9ACTN|nr:hypothetical protein [Virgisporangium aurantiacum]GIJ56868.1 hypothetical protein Vau01_043840 [Virgisporangium aurantiacum]
MRSRLFRGIAAAVACVALTLGAAPPPAQAATPDQYADITFDVLGALLVAAEDGITPGEILALVQLLKGAINGIKVDVVERLDAEVVATLEAKTQYAVSNVFFLEHPLPFYAAIYNNSVSEGAYLARSYLANNVITADGDLDAVGKAMMTLFTTYEVGLAKANAPVAQRNQVFADYRQGLESLIAKMNPHCEEYIEAKVGTVLYNCTYDGVTVRSKFDMDGFSINGGPPIPGGYNPKLVEDFLMASTAKRLAQDALEQLRQRGF